ncbi:hypothetical protein M2105_003815 [Paenibacillus sp. PastF-1]|nr:hypothetical protein [Paenibacillus sp. PastF-2]MDF9849343.1 hypothetical protein [Paenibacillus sp. PastM-2]MDF9855949.1 hypothetical protein [Paenibacillus sp. PastF-1]MDH6481184.1 hypothetical protein [Paenibacillus sp. PastH-2]MDH6508604.1 hypothetical protein [Paenibacillus sp. PastM-3]
MMLKLMRSARSGWKVLNSYQMAPSSFSQAFTGSIIVPPGSSLSTSVTSSSSAVGLVITSALSLTWWES